MLRPFNIVVFVLFSLVIPSSLIGQAQLGTIFGTVTDPSGAVVPNATITVKSVERGTVRKTVATREGEYSVPGLELGSYSVMASAPGFKDAVQSAVEISVSALVRVDFPLEVGSAGQSVQVQSSSPLLQTATAEVGDVITRQELHDLPVFSRNILSVATLTPGTNNGNSSGRQAAISGAEIVINGAPAESNNFIIDGVSNNSEFSGTLSITPPIDAVQEFAVQTGQYSAEYGHSTGGVINIGLKSGTNQLHGFAYDYFQNDLLNAKNFDFTGANPPKPEVRRNQFGGGAGGRIIKDRIFWFGDYEGVRSPSSSVGQYIVPTAAEKNGDFSQAGFNIFDPSTAHPDPTNSSVTVRDQFPNNVIPASKITAVGKGLLSYFPNPNFTSPNPKILNNYLAVSRANEVQNLFNVKTDFVLSAKDSISVHESFQRRILSNTGWLPGGYIGSSIGVNGNNAGSSWTHVLSPTLVNEARASYNRAVIPSVLANSTNVIDPYNIPGWQVNPIGRGFPTISITNITGLAPIREIQAFGPPFRLTENIYQFLDTMSWQKGRHYIKFGVELDHARDDRGQARSGGGTMTFNGVYTTQHPGDAVSSPRNGVADMLVGDSSNLLTQYGFDATRIRNYRFDAFIQDDWHITPKLTFNLGLRYDLFQPYQEEQNRIANFNPVTSTRLVPDSTRTYVQNVLGLPGGNLPPGWAYVPLDQIVQKMNKLDFAPRAGFAYAFTNKFVFRGGWGIYYDFTSSNNFNNAGTEGNPFFFDYQQIGDVNNPLYLPNGLAGGNIYNVLASPSFSAYWGPIHRHEPYAEKYSATFEYSPLKNTVLSAGYTGQRTFHEPTLSPANEGNPPGASSLISREPFPNVGFFWRYTDLNDSNYNALILNITQRFFHGMTFQSTYTWSKALGLDTGTDEQLTWNNNFRYDYGPLDYNIPKRWVTAFTYQEPKLTGMPRIARAALGNWLVSGILTLQSGFPFTVTASGAVLNVGTTGGTGQRANVVGDPNNVSGGQNSSHWFNTAAFVLPPAYTWGNAGRNTQVGPGLKNLDFALQKSFPIISERQRLTFRMEASNLTNRVDWGNPGSNLSGANFGVITGLQAGARKLQAVLRYDF